MKELLVRSATGLVMIAVALGAVVKGGETLALVSGVAALILYAEWLRIVRCWSPLWNVLGLVYAISPAFALIWLRELPEDSIAILVWTFIVTWATDIGAYFAGRALGRTKLAPTISPNKTVEGLAGGVIAAGICSALWVVGIDLEDRVLIILAPFFAVLAQAGDLFESWMKRRAGVKDSANWLPGHGGLLDRLDGFVPVVSATALLRLAGVL